MPTALIQIGLFTSSFAPLFAVFGVLDTFGSGLPSVICYGIAIGGLGVVAFFMVVANRLAPTTLSLQRVTRRDADVLSYVVTYLIPFLGIETGDWRGRTAIVIFVVVTAVLYVRAGLFYINPILGLLGYRLFAADSNERAVVLISRRSFIPSGSRLPARSLSRDVFLLE